MFDTLMGIICAHAYCAFIYIRGVASLYLCTFVKIMNSTSISSLTETDLR